MTSLVEKNKQFISYKRTVVGWINFTCPVGITHNIDPVTFRRITGLGDGVVIGSNEITNEQLELLKSKSIYTFSKEKALSSATTHERA